MNLSQFIHVMRDTKIAQFHISFGIEQDVGWFDITMENVEMMMEIKQTIQNLCKKSCIDVYGFRNFAQNWFCKGTSKVKSNRFKRSQIHVFHKHDNSSPILFIISIRKEVRKQSLHKNPKNRGNN